MMQRLRQSAHSSGQSAHSSGQSAHSSERGASPASVIILIGILVMTAQLILMGGRMAAAHADVAGAAQEAARTGSLAQTWGSVDAAARSAGLDNVARNTKHCGSPTVDAGESDFRQNGFVRVKVTCRVQLSDLGMLPIPGSITVEAYATEIVENYRAID